MIITIDNKTYVAIEIEKLTLLRHLLDELTLPAQQHKVAMERIKEIFGEV